MAKKNSKYKARQKASSRITPQDSPNIAQAKAENKPVEELEIINKDQVKEKLEVNNKPKTKSTKSKKSSVRTYKKGTIAKIFREMISELKKVDWPPFKKTQHHSGVFQKTSTVLLLVLIFSVIVVAFDSGLLFLLQLLTRS